MKFIDEFVFILAVLATFIWIVKQIIKDKNKKGK